MGRGEGEGNFLIHVGVMKVNIEQRVMLTITGETDNIGHDGCVRQSENPQQQTDANNWGESR